MSNTPSPAATPHVFVAGFTVDPALYGETPDKDKIVHYLAMRTQDDGLKEFIVWDAGETPAANEIVEIVTGIDADPVSTDEPGVMNADPDATILSALEACAAWFQEAPIEELEAVEAAIAKNAPIALLTNAIAAAKAKKAAAAEPTTVKVFTVEISDRHDTYLSVHGDENDANAAAWAAVELELEGLDDEIVEKVRAREDAGDLNGAVEILQAHGVFYIDIEEHTVSVPATRGSAVTS